MPWATRQPISTGAEGARAPATDVTTNATIPIANMRRRP